MKRLRFVICATAVSVLLAVLIGQMDWQTSASAGFMPRPAFQPPTITAIDVVRRQAATYQNVPIAMVTDADQSPQSLTVAAVASNHQSGLFFLTNLAVDATGLVTARLFFALQQRRDLCRHLHADRH